MAEKAQTQSSEVKVDLTTDFGELHQAAAAPSLQEGFGVVRAGIQKAPKTQKSRGKSIGKTPAVMAELERPV